MGGGSNNPIISAKEISRLVENARETHWRAREPSLKCSRDPGKAALLDERIESYLADAITKWIPQAFPLDSRKGGSVEALEALRVLGKILAEKHNDTWMNDLIDSVGDPQAFAQAVRWLEKAVSWSAGAEKAQASAAAEGAESWFKKAGSSPGSFRASVEEVYALRNVHRGKECLLKAHAVSNVIERTTYGWIRAQLAADKCSCLLMSGQFAEARQLAAHAIDESGNSAYPTLQLRSLGMAASVESDEGNVLEAWKMNEEGLARYWQNTLSPARRAQQFYDDLSYEAENTGELNLAFSLAQESVQMSVLAKDRALEAMTRGHLAQIAAHTGNLELAESELQSSANILASIANVPGMEAFRVAAEAGLADIESQRGKLSEAEKRLRKVQSEAEGLESFDVLRAYYKAKAAVLMKQGELDSAEKVLRLAICQADRYLVGIRDEHSRYLWTEENAGLYRSFVGLELAKGDKLAALIAWEWYRAALSGYQSTEYKSLESLLDSTIIADAIAEMHEKTLVSYALVPQGLAIWVVNDRGVDARIVPADELTLRFLVARFSEMCADPSSDPVQLQRTGRRLFEILLRPVSSLLEPRHTVSIEPDYLFDDMSFTALVASDGRYLGEKNVITMSSGLLYSNKQQRRGEISAATRALLVGSTASPAAGISSVPPIDGGDEVEEISTLFSKPKILKGHEATVAALGQAIPDYELLHFAGHALAEEQGEGLVMLASGGSPSRIAVWNADQVKPNSLRRCRLVVLSACSTGRSYRGRREKRGALTRSFLIKGVPNVVASHWDVDSLTTTHFMNIFYRALLSGQSIGRSLHTAETELRNQPATAHPYYWAAFSGFSNQ